MLPSNDKRVCKLKKSLYGLKQANKNWYKKLTNALVSFGYTQSHVGYTLFFKNTESFYTCLLIYVDDLIISCDNETEINILKEHLYKQFYIKDLSKLKYFFGIKVSQSKQGVSISQRKYALDILHEFRKLGMRKHKLSYQRSQWCERLPSRAGGSEIHGVRFTSSLPGWN